MQFRSTKSYGPRISLTEKQEAKIIKRVNDAGLTCFIEQCHTGSVYIAIGLPEWEQNIRGEWFHTLDCGCNEDVAKIRLSGHEEGRRNDSDKVCVGDKKTCMEWLEKWLTEICEEHGPKGKAILANVPEGVLAE